MTNEVGPITGSLKPSTRQRRKDIIVRNGDDRSKQHRHGLTIKFSFLTSEHNLLIETEWMVVWRSQRVVDRPGNKV